MSNRNTQSRFSNIPHIDVKRSKFDRSSGVKTTFNAGDLIPIYVDEVLPGDTIDMDMFGVTRMSTPIHPVMDNCYLDSYFFFVPCRLVWDHWKRFMGENEAAPWAQETELSIPQVTAPSGGWQKGTIADYMGIPINVDNISVNSLPFKAYALIWNEWFRDQNLQYPALITKNDNRLDGSNGNSSPAVSAPTNAQLGGMPLRVSKYHDYFTSALPQPQKGEPVSIGLAGTAEVYPYSDLEYKNSVLTFSGSAGEKGTIGVGERLSGSSITMTPSGAWNAGASANANNPNINSVFMLTSSGNPKPIELRADLATATASTINELRQAFAIQRLLERDARGGTRYREVIRAHFGVTSPDARMQIPEYLGGKRIPVNINQVLQTSESTENSPQGNTAAYSLTSGGLGRFTYSATEHGYIIGVACVRTDHSYQQGLNKLWSRERRFDFYFPALANIGEMPIFNKEIYAQGNSQDDEAFGYQEAWAEYRYKPSIITGAFRSTYAQSLDIWHYGDDYSELPKLSGAWIEETKVNIDRTLAVSSEVEDQFIMDLHFKNYWTRPMPIYSVPGLIDRN